MAPNSRRISPSLPRPLEAARVGSLAGRAPAWMMDMRGSAVAGLAGRWEDRRAPLRRGALLDRLHELRHPEGLGDEGPTRLPQARHLEARHEKHPRLRTESDHAAGQLTAVHEGHDHVDEEEVDVACAVLGDAERLHGIVGGE